MDEKDVDFKNKVKNSFLKFKEHMDSLENQIKEIKEIILKKEEEYNLLRKKELDKMADNLYKGFLKEKIEEASSGNEGVYSLTHSLTHDADTTHITDINELKGKFERLPKMKLALYLAVYNLEDQKLPTTYINLSKSIKITEEAVRNYITYLNKNKIPLNKIRVNNKIVLFKIPKMVRELNLKQYLEDLYYGTDSAQGRLTDL